MFKRAKNHSFVIIFCVVNHVYLYKIIWAIKYKLYTLTFFVWLHLTEFLFYFSHWEHNILVLNESAQTIISIYLDKMHTKVEYEHIDVIWWSYWNTWWSFCQWSYTIYCLILLVLLCMFWFYYYDFEIYANINQHVYT